MGTGKEEETVVFNKIVCMSVVSGVELARMVLFFGQYLAVVCVSFCAVNCMGLFMTFSMIRTHFGGFILMVFRVHIQCENISALLGISCLNIMSREE